MILDHSIESEQAVLGGLLVDEQALDSIDELSADWFFLASHQAVAREILERAAQHLPFDPVSLHASLEAKRLLGTTVPRDMVFDLSKGLGTAARISFYVGTIRNAWALRQARLAAEAFSRNVDILNAEAGIGALQLDLARIETGKGSKIITAGELVTELTETLGDELNRKPGTEITSYGLSALDAVATGLEPGRTVIFAARPHSGKTAWATTLAASFASAGIPTAVFWWEDSAKTFAQRVAAQVGQIPVELLRHGTRMRPPWWERLMCAAEMISRWPLYVEATKGLTAADAVRRIRRLRRERGVRIVIADHLGEIRFGEHGFGDRHDLAVGDAAKTIRDECDRLRICPILFHQLGRIAETERVPRLGWLSNSGELEQVGRTIGFLSLDATTFRIHFLKGPPGRTVELAWDPNTYRIAERAAQPEQGRLV